MPFKDDQALLIFFVTLMVTNYVIIRVYPVGSTSNLVIIGGPLSIVVNGIDLWLLFRIENGTLGISILGFLFPLALMTYIAAVRSKKWNLSIDRDYLIGFVGMVLLSFFVARITEQGIAIAAYGFVLYFLLAFFISKSDRWQRPAVKAVQLLSAFWYGLALVDLLLDLWILQSTSPSLMVIGGDRWGIGDSLWTYPLLMSALAFLSAFFRRYYHQRPRRCDTGIQRDA